MKGCSKGALFSSMEIINIVVRNNLLLKSVVFKCFNLKATSTE